MIKLYASGTARSRRVQWACEEVGAPYERIELKWPPAANPGFLEVNPAGTVPVMEDGGVRIAESLAICEYVSRTHGGDLVIEPSEPTYYEYLELTQFGEATLQPALAWARRFGPYSPEILDYARTAYVTRLGVLERALDDGREFLVAGRLTLADLSVGFPLTLATHIPGIGDLLTDAVAAYRDRLMARPAWKRAYRGA
jgi:glutathione S-transferase